MAKCKGKKKGRQKKKERAPALCRWYKVLPTDLMCWLNYWTPIRVSPELIVNETAK